MMMLPQEGLGRRAFLTSSMALTCSMLTACARPRQAQFAAVDQLVRTAIRDGQAPGAVVAIGHEGQVVHRYVYGNRALVPQQEPMTWETHFDMASLTKPTMTALAVMQLVERGDLRLDDPVTRYLPAFGSNGKSGITLRLLLTHYSGLPAHLPLADRRRGEP